MSSAPALVLYGRTYWDAEVEVDLDSLAAGKGKQDVPVRVMLGGWGCNAARTLAPRFGEGAVRVVTVSSSLDLARLRAQLPDGVHVTAIDSGETARDMPPVSVIVNPSSACRLLRDPLGENDARWSWEAVPAEAHAARLHLIGRVPASFARDVVVAAAEHGGRTGWVGGDALPIELERELDVVCVNSAEAGRLLATDGAAPRDNALLLMERTDRPAAVRVVTGGSKSPTVAAVREPDGVRCYEASAALIPRERITRLKGAGDCFAATFLAATWFDAAGELLPAPRVAAALAEAQRATEDFITQEWP